VLREHGGAVPSSVSSRLSPSQMRRDVLPARCALKSSRPQGHLSAGLGASLNPALNRHAARRRKKCLSFPSASGRELSSELRAGKLTLSVPVFRRKREVRVSGQALLQQSLSSCQLVCIQEHERNPQLCFWQATAKGRRTPSSRVAPGRTFGRSREAVGEMISARERLLRAQSDAALLGRRSSVYPRDLGQGYHRRARLWHGWPPKLSPARAEHPGCSSRCLRWMGWGFRGAGGRLLLCKGKTLPWNILWCSCKALAFTWEVLVLFGVSWRRKSCWLDLPLQDVHVLLLPLSALSLEPRVCAQGCQDR